MTQHATTKRKQPQKPISAITLHPKLKKSDYKISPTFADVDNWKAKVWHCNSGDVRPGKFDSVGYVMIEAETGYIVPIARSDEHHIGYDTLHELKRKFKFEGNFTSIYVAGTNFYDNNAQLPKLYPAYSFILKHGAKSRPLKRWDRKIAYPTADLLTFHKTGYPDRWSPGQMSPFAIRLFNAFHAIPAATNPYQLLDANPTALVDLFIEIETMLEAMPYEFRHGYQALKGWPTEEAIFGHKGLHGILHNALRQLLKPPPYSDYSIEDLSATFGDPAECVKHMSAQFQIRPN